MKASKFFEDLFVESIADTQSWQETAKTAKVSSMTVYDPIY